MMVLIFKKAKLKEFKAANKLCQKIHLLNQFLS